MANQATHTIYATRRREPVHIGEGSYLGDCTSCGSPVRMLYDEDNDEPAPGYCTGCYRRYGVAVAVQLTEHLS